MRDMSWPTVAAVLGAIVLISNALEKIIAAFKFAKAPENQQNTRIAELEKAVGKIEGKLSKDKERLDDADVANRVQQEALLALLGHGINGNNLEQMQAAKEHLQNYLINHR